MLVVVATLVHLSHFDSSISPKRFTHSETISGVCISRHVALTQKVFFTFPNVSFLLQLGYIAVQQLKMLKKLKVKATLIEEK